MDVSRSQGWMTPVWSLDYCSYVSRVKYKVQPEADQD